MIDSPKLPSTRGQRFAWCLYDFANSSFPTVIVTAIYVRYFKGVVVASPDPGYSDWLWGMSNSLAALIVFLSAPLLGSIADLAGRKRLFLVAATFLCVIGTSLLALTEAGTVAAAIVFFVIAVIGFESASVFYNSFLPQLATSETMGRLSGQGWALGYIGGLGCLLAAGAMVPEQIRWVPVLVAAWYLIFALPAFRVLKDKRADSARGAGSYVSQAISRIKKTLLTAKSNPAFNKFLISYFFYNNAVNTIIVFAVAFSGDSLGFTVKESILLMIVMNVIAAPGAYFFGKIADAVGAKRTLVATLVMWLTVVAGAMLAAWPELFTFEAAKGVFWAVAGLASLCIGAVQATSRSFIGQMAPPGQSAEFYGFQAFAGKSSAVAGPIAFGLASDVFDSQLAGVASTGLFFAVGLALLLRVPSFKNQTA